MEGPTRRRRGATTGVIVLLAAGLLIARVGAAHPPAAPLPQAADERRLTDWPGAESTPRFSPDGEWVTFSAAPAGQSNIFVIHVGDGTVRQLTDSPAPDRYPAWSPDGSTIAFRSTRDGVAGIWSVPVGGGDEKLLFSRRGVTPLAPDYGPDGRLVMTVIEPDPTRSYGYVTPWVMNADGSDARSLTRGGDEWFGRWSSDGQRIFYYGGNADPIETVHVGSGAIRSVSDGRHVGWRPAPSRDGSMLAFVSSPDATAWLRTLDSEPLFLRLSTRGVDDFPEISPDGSQVAFSSDRSVGSIVALDLRSGARAVVTEGVAPRPLAGGGLAFLTEDKPAALMFLDPGAAAPRAWPVHLAGILGYDVSPSGGALLVTSTAGPAQGSQQMYLASLAGEARPLDTTVGESPVFCDRDDTVLINRNHGEFRQLFAVNLSDGTQRQLTDDRTSKRLTACSADGTRLSYRFTSGRSGTVVLRRTAAGWVKDTQIDGAPEGAVSPDGTRLAYVSTVDGQADVFIREPDGAVTRVTDDALAEAQIRWAPGGDRLYFVVRRPAQDLWIRRVPPRRDWKPLAAWRDVPPGHRN